MDGKERQVENNNHQGLNGDEDASDNLLADAVLELKRSIDDGTVTTQLKQLDLRIGQMDLGPKDADAAISNIFEELRQDGQLPDLVSKFYAENKDRLKQDGKSYLDLESLDKRLPNAGLYDLNRPERHIAAFIADNANAISDAATNLGWSQGNMSDADFEWYAKQQKEALHKFDMAQKLQKHFGEQESFDSLTEAVDSASGKDQYVMPNDVTAAKSFNKWMSNFTKDNDLKLEAKERQNALDYLSENLYEITGGSHYLDRDSLKEYLENTKDPRLEQRLSKNSRMFVGNPGPEAFQKAVAEGYKGSLEKFTTDFVETKGKEGWTTGKALSELNKPSVYSGYKADVVRDYLIANKEALGAARTHKITKHALEELKEKKVSEGKIREVEILDTAISRFQNIANSQKENYFDDTHIASIDLHKYSESERAMRQKADHDSNMHTLAYKNIHELSGESKAKDPYSIKVPWSKIDTMRKMYSANESDLSFSTEEREHSKQMRELCSYLEERLRMQPRGRSTDGYNFSLNDSYAMQKRMNSHNEDQFDAPDMQKTTELSVETTPEKPVRDNALETGIEESDYERAAVGEPIKPYGETFRYTATPLDSISPEFKRQKLSDYRTTELFLDLKAEKSTEEEQETSRIQSDLTGLTYDQLKPVRESELPRQWRPASPQEIESELGRNSVETDSMPEAMPKTPEAMPEVSQKEISKSVEGNLQIAKTKAAFEFGESNYANALKEAARKNLPLVLIAGSKNSTDQFLKDAASQAAQGAGKAVYVFVDLNEADEKLPITKYLESNISERNRITGGHDDNWVSVFNVGRGQNGEIINDAPVYAETNVSAANTESVRNALEQAAQLRQTRNSGYGNNQFQSPTQYQQQAQPQFSQPYPQQFQQPFQQQANAQCQPMEGHPALTANQQMPTCEGQVLQPAFPIANYIRNHRPVVSFFRNHQPVRRAVRWLVN